MDRPVRHILSLSGGEPGVSDIVHSGFRSESSAAPRPYQREGG